MAPQFALSLPKERVFLYAHDHADDSSATADTLASHSVVIVGIGALGCPAALSLAEDGIGHLTLIDDDLVEPSNLQRQILFADDDVGSGKVEVAARVLRQRYSGLDVKEHAVRLDETNCGTLLAGHDYVIDACDDPPTKFLISRTCVGDGIPFCYGGVVQTHGQWLHVVPGQSPCLACVFSDAESEGDDGGCAALGILAPVAGVIGAGQAREATVFLSSRAETHTAPYAGRLNTYDLLGSGRGTVDVSGLPPCRHCRAVAADDSPRRPEQCHS